MPFPAMKGMPLIFAPIKPTRRPSANANPEAPAAISAGTRIRSPQGIVVFTAITTERDANNSLDAVENQNVAIVRIATAPATG